MEEIERGFVKKKLLLNAILYLFSPLIESMDMNSLRVQLIFVVVIKLNKPKPSYQKKMSLN